jgi:(1->4)-alpha-D-glucan 1-alpha-D-glucosylmutase
VALRMEDPVVFEETHRLVRELFAKGLLTGLRIDHIDGLFNPANYLYRLQRDCWVEAVAHRLSQDPELARTDLAVLKQNLMEKFESKSKSKSGATFRPVYVVVEKILAENESLNKDWPIAGTTGYDFMAALDQLLVDNKQSRRLLDTYRRFTSSNTSFEDVAYSCKNLVMKTTMAGEVNILAHHLNTVSEQGWQYRDFTLNSLRDAIREVIACFPRFRTYIDAFEGSISDNDKAVIDGAIAGAIRRNPAVSSALFNFVRDTLLLQYPSGMDESGRNEQRLFVMRFQQLTGPVMAKGVEDTAFYIYNPLVSLNEVGGNPHHFGTSVKVFHQENVKRQADSPRSFIATSTHDSKRGEDVRARIHVLSEIPRKWNSALGRWSRFNRNKKIKLNGEPVPDRNEEYLLYQNLIGTYPLRKMTEKNRASYCSRIQNYLLKALKEAKVHTSWINPNIPYEEGSAHFVEAILDPSPDNQFLADFRQFNQVAAICGMYNSLSQVVVKNLSPGVPDLFQGNELWAFNLTDPDNRNPVDYEYRIQLLHQMKERVANSSRLKDIAKDLLNKSEDGRIKLYVTWKTLNYRRNNKTLFDGTYLPIRTKGTEKDHLCVFAWKKEEKELIVAVPRLFVSLTHQVKIKPLGEKVWGDTSIVMPRKLNSQSYRNIFTDEILKVNVQKDGLKISVAEILKSFPVAAIEVYPTV